MTAARRPRAVLCAAAAVALWLAWSTAEVRAAPLEPALCPVESVDPECGQPAANRPPAAANDQLRLRPGATGRTNVLGNDVDPDGDPLTVRPRKGRTLESARFEFAADGTFTYTPAPGFLGVFSFEYTVSDGRGGSDVGAVDIEVVNRPPVAVADRFTTSPAHALSAGLLGNDSDPDGDPLSTGTGTITTAAGGQVTFYGDGLFSYRTPAGFVGVDRFQYGLVDSYGSSDTGDVTIGVGVSA